MSVIKIVRMQCSLDEIQRLTDAHPEVVNVLVAAAEKYMTNNTFAAREGEVIEVNEFATEEDHEAFIAEAGDAIAAFDVLLGSPSQPTLYTKLDY